MTLYLFGNLVGRLVVSYVLVWVILLLVAKFDWRKAFRNSVRWYGLLAVLVLFGLGLAAFEQRGGFA